MTEEQGNAVRQAYLQMLLAINSTCSPLQCWWVHNAERLGGPMLHSKQLLVSSNQPIATSQQPTCHAACQQVDVQYNLRGAGSQALPAVLPGPANSPGLDLSCHVAQQLAISQQPTCDATGQRVGIAEGVNGCQGFKGCLVVAQQGVHPEQADEGEVAQCAQHIAALGLVPLSLCKATLGICSTDRLLSHKGKGPTRGMRVRALPGSPVSLQSRVSCNVCTVCGCSEPCALWSCMSSTGQISGSAHGCSSTKTGSGKQAGHDQ